MRGLVTINEGLSCLFPSKKKERNTFEVIDDDDILLFCCIQGISVNRLDYSQEEFEKLKISAMKERQKTQENRRNKILETLINL